MNYFDHILPLSLGSDFCGKLFNDISNNVEDFNVYLNNSMYVDLP